MRIVLEERSALEVGFIKLFEWPGFTGGAMGKSRFTLMGRGGEQWYTDGFSGCHYRSFEMMKIPLYRPDGNTIDRIGYDSGS